MPLVLIHIGKTGGSFIKRMMQKLYNKKIKQYHGDFKKYKTDTEQYIIWVRNPIARFVSAFNYVHTIINLKKSELTQEQKKNKTIKDFFAVKHVTNEYNPRYKRIVNTIGSANNLAESLFSTDPDVAWMVKIIMKTEIYNHLKCGIGWYLYNGDFLKEHNDKIFFVGKQETLDEDFTKLCEKINIKPMEEFKRINENILSKPEDKILSPLAIKNIIEWYKDTDYAALIELERHGWITKETLDSYYIY